VVYVLESQEFDIPSLGSPDLASGLFSFIGLIVLSLCQCFDTVVGDRRAVSMQKPLPHIPQSFFIHIQQQQQQPFYGPSLSIWLEKKN